MNLLSVVCVCISVCFRMKIIGCLAQSRLRQTRNATINGFEKYYFKNRVKVCWKKCYEKQCRLWRTCMMKYEDSPTKGVVIPSVLPSSHPCGLPVFFSLLPFISCCRSPAATMLHVNSGMPSCCWTHVLLFPWHWFSVKKKKKTQTF